MPNREEVIADLTFAQVIQNGNGASFVALEPETVSDAIALLKKQEHKDRMFHALEEDWKRLKALLKEQEEREKAICKEICDFIRGSCSTDTYSDKEYVCNVVQQMFINGRAVKWE